MICGSHVPTAEELRQLDYDYLLNKHPRAMGIVGLAFQEPVDDNVMTNEDQRLLDSYIEDEFSKDDFKDDLDPGGITPDMEEEYYYLGSLFFYLHWGQCFA